MLKRLWRNTVVFLDAIKVSHSIFALPFAMAAALMAQRGGFPPISTLGKIVLACIAARTAAMAFNRYADAEFDRRNERTRGRAVPAGKLAPSFMLGMTVLSSLGFVAIAWWINNLALVLSPVVLAVLLGYSYTKRFTPYSHLVLGAALGLSPLGAWVAVRGELDGRAAILGLAVLCWTAGFDLIYACQDVEFDQRAGLHSIPARFGVRRALWISVLLHAATVALLVACGALMGYGAPYYGGVAVVAIALGYEHTLVKPGDLSRVNVAFFTLNGFVSLVFVAAVALQAMVLSELGSLERDSRSRAAASRRSEDIRSGPRAEHLEATLPSTTS